MLIHLFVLITFGVAAHAAAISLPQLNSNEIRRRDDSSTPYMITEASKDPVVRAAAIQLKRQTFLYGPDPDGSSVFYPAGPLGNATASRDLAELEAQLAIHGAAVTQDTQVAAAVVLKARHRSPTIASAF